MGCSVDSLEQRWCHCPRRSPHRISVGGTFTPQERQLASLHKFTTARSIAAATLSASHLENAVAMFRNDCGTVVGLTCLLLSAFETFSPDGGMDLVTSIAGRRRMRSFARYRAGP
jgi:hypothetical protein